MAARKQDFSEKFLLGGGEMGSLIRAKDWSKTAIGPLAQWPQSLKTTLGIILNSKFPMFLWWGPELLCFYNDAYRPSLGKEGKHPAILGQHAKDAWPETWHIIKPLIDNVMAGGEATWSEDQLVPIYRNGAMEDVYWTFSYSAVHDEDGTVAGVFVTCTETTDKVLNQKKVVDSERNFRNLVNEAPVSTAVFTGPEYVIELANDEALNLWGKDKSVIGKKLTDAIPELKGQPYLKILDDVYATGDTYEGKENLAYLHRDGQLLPVYVTFIYRALLDSDDNIYAILTMGYDVTEQVNARNKVAAAEERTRLAIDAALLGIYDMNLITDEVVLSDGLREMLRVNNGAVTHRDILNFLHPDDVGIREGAFAAALTSGKLSYEARMILPDKAVRWVRAAGTLFTDKTGKPLRILGTLRDTTEEKQFIQKIEESEERARLAIDGAALGTFDIYIPTYQIVCSQRFREIFGQADPDLPYQEVIKGFHPDDLPIRDAANQQAMITGQLDYEMRIIWPDKSIHWINVKGKLYFDDNKAPLRVLGTVNDITEQKEVLKKMEDLEEGSRLAIEAGDLGTFDINYVTGYFTGSGRTSEIFGYEGRPVTHQNVIDALHKDDVHIRNASHELSVRTGYLHYEARLVWPDQSIHWVNIRGRVFYDKNKTPVRVLGIATDITAQKLYAETLEDKERQFRNTVMQAPVGITILRGADYLVEMANEPYLQLVDRAEKDFVGRPLFDALPEVKDTVAPLLLTVLQTGEPFYGNEIEIPIKRRGRIEAGYFNFVYKALKEDDGSISGIIVVVNDVSAQVQIKQALEESERRFRNIVAQSPVAMAVLRGRDMTIEIANETMIKNLWRRDSTVIGKKLMDVFPELANQKYPQLIAQIFETGMPHRSSEAEALIDGPDGMRKYYIDLEYAPLFEPDGAVSGVMATATDVTEKVEARKKIEDTRKRYSDLIDTLPVGILTVNLEGHIDVFNEAAVAIWGRTPVRGVDKWGGATAMYTIDGIKIPQDKNPIMLALAENRALEMEVYIERPDGERRHVIKYPKPIHDSEGKVIGAMQAIIDITDSKNAEMALRVSEQRFSLLSQMMPQQLWTSDPEGNLNYFSQAVFHNSGLTTEQLKTGGWLQIVHPDDRDENVKRWIHSVQTGENFNFEHRFLRYDGEYRWQLSQALPQRDNDGKIMMWVGTSTDIHEQKTFAQSLENKVAERTKDLQAANSQLEKTNHELASFAYVSSHDLQEPLRKIQTFASLILEREKDTLSPIGMDYFQRIQRSAKRMQALIEDLLAYSRTNTKEKVYEKTDLNMLLQDVKTELEQLISERGASLHASPLPVLNIIPYQFRQLFTNIISNSLKFARKNVPMSISIQADVYTNDNMDLHPYHSYWLIAISDNGIGFDPLYGKRIFEVFQRLHGKDEYEGTGIGLAICKKIVENHNGFITATGEPNKGATFSIYIPIE